MYNINRDTSVKNLHLNSIIIEVRGTKYIDAQDFELQYHISVVVFFLSNSILQDENSFLNFRLFFY